MIGVSRERCPLIEDQLLRLVEKYPAIGFWKSFHQIRRKGYGWNHKRVYRTYSQLSFKYPQKAQKAVAGPG